MRRGMVAAAFGIVMTGCGGGMASVTTRSPTGASTPSTTATPQPTPTNHVTLSGALIGDLTGIRATCGQQEVVGGSVFTRYVAASGTLNGRAVSIEIFDPKTPGDYESLSYGI